MNKITKDNFYDKIHEIPCTNCGVSAEYYFDNDDEPLCESCTFEILKDGCNELFAIEDLDDEEENDIEVANQLWQNRKDK